MLASEPKFATTKALRCDERCPTMALWREGRWSHPRMIKIDQSFVRPKHDKERSDMLLEAIVTLSNKLGMIVLAEGIETPAQLDRLHHLDCDLGQGFLWSPAVSAEEAATILEREVVV